MEPRVLKLPSNSTSATQGSCHSNSWKKCMGCLYPTTTQTPEPYVTESSLESFPSSEVQESKPLMLKAHPLLTDSSQGLRELLYRDCIYLVSLLPESGESAIYPLAPCTTRSSQRASRRYLDVHGSFLGGYKSPKLGYKHSINFML